MAGRAEEPSVGVFWDYENVRFPSGYAPHAALGALRDLALSHGKIEVMRNYMDTTYERGNRNTDLRAQLQQAGFTVVDVPHSDRKDVVDKMIMVDLVVFGIESRPCPVVILITGDRDFAYACSTLRNKRCKVVLVTTESASLSLRQSAAEILSWRMDILKLEPTKKGKKAPNSEQRRLPSKEYAKLDRVAIGTTSNGGGIAGYRVSSTSTFQKPIHPVLATHAAAASGSSHRMPPAFLPPLAYLVPSHSQSQPHPHPTPQPAPLEPLDLTGSVERKLPQGRKRRTSSRGTADEGMGKGRAVEVIELTDDDEEEGEEQTVQQSRPQPLDTDSDSDLDLLPPPPKRATPGATSTSSRRATYGLPAPALDPSSHPASAMEESEFGTSPAGRIEVLYHLDGGGGGGTSAKAGKKRARALVDEEDAAAHPLPASVLDPSNPLTPFASRSTRSGRVFAADPDSMDAEPSPLVARKKKRTSLGKKVAKEAAGRQREKKKIAPEPPEEDDECESESDSVVVLEE
ncbi:hypothetical protein JCM10213_006638 [Rhodosporidiobolus nylandii]